MVRKLARLDGEARLLHLQHAPHGAAGAVAADDEVKRLAPRRIAGGGGGAAQLDEPVGCADDGGVCAEAHGDGVAGCGLELGLQRAADVAARARPAGLRGALLHVERGDAEAEERYEGRIEAAGRADIVGRAGAVARDVDRVRTVRVICCGPAVVVGALEHGRAHRGAGGGAARERNGKREAGRPGADDGNA